MTEDSIGALPAAKINAVRRNLCMLILFLTMLFNSADRVVISVIIDSVKAEFALSDTMLGLLTGPAFAFLYVLCSLPVARLADIGNRCTVLMGALAFWSLMTGLCGISQNIWQFFLCRMGVGIGEAGASPPTYSLVSSYYPPERRSAALGFVNIGASASQLLIYVAGGVIIVNYGWRLLPILLGIGGLVVALMGCFILRETRESRPSSSFKTDLYAGVKAAKALLRIPALRHFVAAFTILMIVGLGVFMWDVAFFSRSYDVPLENITAALGISGFLSGMSGLLFGGWLGNYFGKRNLKSLGMVAGSLLIAAFPFLAGKYLVHDYYLAIAFSTGGAFFFGSFFGPFMAAVQTTVTEHDRTLAAALPLFFANLIGMGAGPVMIGVLSDLLTHLGTAESLRWTLALSIFLLPWAGWHAFRGSKCLQVSVPLDSHTSS